MEPMRSDAFIHVVCGSRRVNIRLGVLLLIPKSPQIHTIIIQQQFYYIDSKKKNSSNSCVLLLYRIIIFQYSSFVNFLLFLSVLISFYSILTCSLIKRVLPRLTIGEVFPVWLVTVVPHQVATHSLLSLDMSLVG